MATMSTHERTALSTDDVQKPSRRMRAPDMWRASPLTSIALIVAVILSIFPLYWTFVMASHTNSDVTSIPPPLTPGGNLQENTKRLFDNPDVMFAKALVNSAIVSTAVTLAVVITSTLAGFAFAKLKFRGRGILLILVIGTIMVPVQLGLIPLYMLMGWIHLQGSLASVILPFVASAFGVFMMRQYISQAVPDELIEAARVDGASTLRIYVNIVLPAARPAIAVLSLLVFMQTWNEFLWPYLALNPDNPTVQVALAHLSSGYYTDLSLVLAGTAVATIPLLVVFAIFGRHIIGGIMEGAVKT